MCKKSNQLVNAVKLEEVDVIFVSSKVAFKKDYLQYHDSLHFRGYLSARATIFAGVDELFKEKSFSTVYFVNKYHDAKFLMLAMQEFEAMGDEYLFNIVIGEEMATANRYV